MRVAHIIMAHKNPVQLRRLIERIQHPQFDIHVHLDAKVNIDEFKLIKELPNVRFIENRIDCNWGGFNFLKAIFTSLNEVIDLGQSYDFINLLSAQDYPIHSAQYIYEFLQKKIGQIFISFDASNKSEWWKHAEDRYKKYHLTDLNIKGKYFIQALLNKIAPDRKLPGSLKLYGGSKSSWWTITGESAQYITKKINTSPKLYRFLKYCWGADEFVIATLIMNSPFKKQVINDNLRFIDWSEGNAHPKLLALSDFENIASSNMLYARKFDIDFDLDILNKIDEVLITQNDK